MAADTSLASIISTFGDATESAIKSLPDAASLFPPKNGISLLDAKNEIFLSYLQALALRNLNVIRSSKHGASVEETQQLSDEITGKLVEHRVYLERGVKPLEQKIKYQLDRYVKLAEDEERAQVQRAKKTEAVNGAGENDNSGSEEESSDEDDEQDILAFKPSGLAMSRPQIKGADEVQKPRDDVEGAYRPPRISATSMPTTEAREAKPSKPERSRTLDEYIRTELSAAPLAEPSIGSTIAAGGRTTKNARQLAREQERRDYEETHLMRLPPESKKERAKHKARERNGGFGGEEWRGIGESVDKIDSLTKRKKEGVLERSRKRRAVEDGPRNDGTAGSAFDIKKRRVLKKMKR